MSNPRRQSVLSSALSPALVRRALDEAWPDDCADPVLFFERFLASARKATCETLLGGRTAPARLRATIALLSLQGAKGPRPTPLGRARSTTIAEHRGWPVELSGPGPFLEVADDEGTLVVRAEPAQIEALWLDGALPFGERRVVYQPRSELEGAEALTAVAAPFDLGFLRSASERRNDRFPSPPDVEAAWRLARLLDEVLNEGQGAGELDDVLAAAAEREAALLADWTRRRGLVELLTATVNRVRAQGGSLTLESCDVHLNTRELHARSLLSGASFRAPLEELTRGRLVVHSLSWDGREHALIVERDGPATAQPPLDVMLDLVLELCSLEEELGLRVH